MHTLQINTTQLTDKQNARIIKLQQKLEDTRTRKTNTLRKNNAHPTAQTQVNNNIQPHFYSLPRSTRQGRPNPDPPCLYYAKHFSPFHHHTSQDPSSITFNCSHPCISLAPNNCPSNPSFASTSSNNHDIPLVV